MFLLSSRKHYLRFHYFGSYLIPILLFCIPNVSQGNQQYEELLLKPVESILDRQFKFPGDDSHDYASLSIYWWPDPVKKLPYIQKDGEINPEVELYDAPRFRGMITTIKSLADAFKETGDKRFAENADKRLRVWFLNEKTRMNPALRYAQFIPGLYEATYHGLIEGDMLCTSFLDGISLFEEQQGLEPQTLEGLKDWFDKLKQWFLTSDLGKEEGAQNTNHGIWYDYQVARYAEFAGDKATLLKTLKNVGEKRIAVQIKADGRMPAEMKRTKSYSYVCYALQPLLMLAEMGDKYGVDIAGYTAPSGASVAQALKYALIQSKDPEKWPGKQIVTLDRQAIVNLTKQYLKLRDNVELRQLLDESKP